MSLASMSTLSLLGSCAVMACMLGNFAKIFVTLSYSGVCKKEKYIIVWYDDVLTHVLVRVHPLTPAVHAHRLLESPFTQYTQGFWMCQDLVSAYTHAHTHHAPTCGFSASSDGCLGSIIVGKGSKISSRRLDVLAALARAISKSTTCNSTITTCHIHVLCR